MKYLKNIILTVLLSFGLAGVSYGGTITSGSVTFANSRTSLVAANAFFAPNGVDLSAYAGVAGSHTPYLVKLFDSAGKLAYGWAAEVGAGETLGADAVAGWDFTSDWTANTNCTIDDANSFTITAISGVWKISLLDTAKLYKLVLDFSTTSSELWLVNSVSPPYEPYFNSNGTHYFTARTNGFYFRGLSAGTTDVNTFSVEVVTDCAATGLHIVSSRNGSTQSWSYVESGFNYNDTSGYTYQIIKQGVAAAGW